jgi:hypothetical protein
MITKVINGEEYKLVPHCEPRSCVGCAFEDDDERDAFSGCTQAGWDCFGDDSIWIKSQ